MGAVTTLAATVAAAAGAIALFRFAEKKKKEFAKVFRDGEVKSGAPEKVIDFEQDPQSGVFKAKD